MYNHSHLVTIGRPHRRWRPLADFMTSVRREPPRPAQAFCAQCGGPLNDQGRWSLPRPPACLTAPRQIAHCGQWFAVTTLPFVCPACGEVLLHEGTPP